jgi:hypothetical protein
MFCLFISEQPSLALSVRYPSETPRAPATLESGENHKSLSLSLSIFLYVRVCVMFGLMEKTPGDGAQSVEKV